jgi:hypothetical protein
MNIHAEAFINPHMAQVNTNSRKKQGTCHYPQLDSMQVLNNSFNPTPFTDYPIA